MQALYELIRRHREERHVITYNDLLELEQRLLASATQPSESSSTPERVALPPGTVSVPLEDLESAAEALGRFCSDLGWSDEDMQIMDNIGAVLAQHKAANGIKGAQQ